MGKSYSDEGGIVGAGDYEVGLDLDIHKDAQELINRTLKKLVLHP